MVTKWGLSEKLGPLMYDEDDGEVFLGMSAGAKPRPIHQKRPTQLIKKCDRLLTIVMARQRTC